jgi:polyadenylate-binding protein 2
LEQHFHGCGSINRVTILCNKFDGHPKGFAYIEFAERDSVQTAMAMDESLFRGRQIKVSSMVEKVILFLTSMTVVTRRF